jgi:7-carboxy-7-deazaguanine synthase
MTKSLMVNEIFLSLQGESTYAGLLCVFIRLTGCDLRCSYCDTAYAFSEGKRMSIDEIYDEVIRLSKSYDKFKRRLPIIEVTGGEPLLQPSTPALLKRFCDIGFTVLLETSGAHDISVTPPQVKRIMDLKCPSSGEADKNMWENIKHLKSDDEIKFVIASFQDYQWAMKIIGDYKLNEICTVLFSWAEPISTGQSCLKAFPLEHKRISRRELVELILKDGLPVRFQLQLHKIIWPDILKGV